MLSKLLQILSRNIDVSFKNKIRQFYHSCILEQQLMLIIIFIISKNFIPNKFLRLKSTHIRPRTCYTRIHVKRRGCSHATKNIYVSSICLERMVQNSEALRIARSYEIWQKQNAILEWRAPVSLKWDFFSVPKFICIFLCLHTSILLWNI